MMCMVDNNIPNLPCGNPSRENHSKYETGKSHKTMFLYLPNGILISTNSFSNTGHNPYNSACILSKIQFCTGK